MQAEQIIGTILLRDRFRSDRYHYLVRAVAAVTLMLALSGLGNAVMLMEPVQYRYLMTKPTGQLYDIVPLAQPHVADSEVLKWTADAITRINTFDFMNYRRQFQDAQNDLTLAGWNHFEKALKESGNFVAVTENRYVTTAAPTGPARLIGKGVMASSDGTSRFGWTVEIPVLVTYRSSVQATSQDLVMTVTVVRMPVWMNRGTGLGVRQIIAR